ncbi:aldose 1-epimerase family protein [Oceanobacillus jeddahense]|uniref:Aldose 1-epimerase family protein n=1 Tax=Oceanobacillus jeddahense TaxID=1462527 RepID=A0ABY5JTZ5_9BACI|nr:aldose 1-epimerase family protein [Oceanobacillus jeddahense]UUI03808.1 aldose 1-epimerase family protein [Oceanobacillus jeddahense]
MKQTIENEWLKVEIESNGAEIQSVEHKKNTLKYMWTGDSAYWGRVAPVLFPIVGRLKEDQYHLDGQTYEMSQHGFLRDVDFELSSLSAEHVSFKVASDGRFKNIFPYEFKATITYSLHQDSLSVDWKIENQNDTEMYFSIGAHPAFRIPLLENEGLEDYQLTFTPNPDKEVMEYGLENALVHEKGIRNHLPDITLQPDLFAKDAMIYSHIDRIELASTKLNHGVEVVFTDFPFVGIWSKYNEENNTIAPFVCIEPWCGIADMHDTTGDLKEKFGMNRLEADEVFQKEYTMIFK